MWKCTFQYDYATLHGQVMNELVYSQCTKVTESKQEPGEFTRQVSKSEFMSGPDQTSPSPDQIMKSATIFFYNSSSDSVSVNTLNGRLIHYKCASL